MTSDLTSLDIFIIWSLMPASAISDMRLYVTAPDIFIVIATLVGVCDDQ